MNYNQGYYDNFDFDDFDGFDSYESRQRPNQQTCTFPQNWCNDNFDNRPMRKEHNDRNWNNNNCRMICFKCCRERRCDRRPERECNCRPQNHRRCGCCGFFNIFHC